MRMPLIIDEHGLGVMDGTMDPSMPGVDLDGVDLFGDPVDLGMATGMAAGMAAGMATTRPPSKQLLERVDEMRSRGCSQKIAWSKQGTIASVSQDGRSIDLRYLRCHPSDGSWGVSEATAYTNFGNSFSSQIVHLAWASTSSPELAVIDAFGRVGILSFTINLNKPYHMRHWDSDPVDDLNAVVGSYWLPLPPQSKQQYVPLHGPAVREGNIYKYENSYMPAIGPFHPNQAKSAFLCVTTNGVLKLFFSQNNNRVQETTLELESITTSDDLITHASICSDKSGFLYVALATASKQLKILKAAIQWGLPNGDKQMPTGAHSHPLSPTLREKRVAVTSWLLNDENGGASHLDWSMTQLSILELFPATLANNHQSWAPPLVLAVRSWVGVAGASAYGSEVQSIIDVWEILNDQPQTLHPAFKQLSSRNGLGSAPAPATRLRKRDPVVINKVVVSVHSLQPGKVLCLAFSDGTVQYRDRFTMEEIYTGVDLDRIMTLSQMGFRFAEGSPCLQAAFSPTNCSFAQICEDGKIKWNNLRYPSTDIGSNTQDAEYHAVIAGLTVAVSGAAGSQMNYDDILAIARQFQGKPRFAYDWMMEIVRMLKIHVDYSEEAPHDPLVRNSHLQLCLSILNHMGFHGDFNPRSFCGKFAMLTLNVRNIVILITIANNTPLNLKEKLSPLDEHEVVDALAGCVKWALDLLSWLSDSLFQLMDDQKFRSLLNPQEWKDVVPYLQSKNEVSLHLLLCSSTRGFVSAACRRLLHLDSLSSRAIQYYENQSRQLEGEPVQNKLYQAYQKMQRYTSGSLVKVHEFDRLLSVLGADIRSAYQASLLPLAQKSAAAGAGVGGPGGGKGGGGQGQGQQGGGGGGQNQGQVADQAVKRAQTHCELQILLGNAPPGYFLAILNKFFNVDLAAFKAQTNPAALFFADFGLLDVVDDRGSLAKKKEKGTYVDVFKKVELSLVPSRGEEEEDRLYRQQQNEQQQSQQHSHGPQRTTTPLRRRCVRCAAVMEEVTGHKPGYTFVVAQQRRCSCGGNWALLASGSTVG